MITNKQIFLHIIRKAEYDDLSFSLVLDNTGSGKEINLSEKLTGFPVKKKFFHITFYFHVIKDLFPLNDEIFASFIEDSNYIILLLTNTEKFKKLSRFVFRLLDENTYQLGKRDLINIITTNLFIKNEKNKLETLNIILREMFSELEKYSSLIACFNLQEQEFLASTVEGVEENELAKEVFLELSKLEKFTPDDFEIKLVKIGSDVQCCWFTFNSLVIIIYAIKINVNAGIIRLKLRTWIKNHRERFDGLLKEISSTNAKNIELKGEIILTRAKNYVEFAFTFPTPFKQDNE